MNSNLSWPCFEMYNSDKETAFENMCRVLFKKRFLADNIILHSNPNNPGIEVEPVKQENTGKLISFQAKYFEPKINYSQIKDSAKKAIEHYSGKLDILYLYCNKDVTTTSKPYQEIESLLNASGIDLVPITNQSILDSVLDYPELATLYFKKHNLTKEWFETQLQTALDDLGQRYNGKFNISTETEHNVGLFVRQADAAVSINQKKVKAVKELKRKRGKYYEHRGLIDKAIILINALNDVNVDTLNDCLGWAGYLETALQENLITIQTIISKLEDDLNHPEINQEESHKKYNEKRDLEWLEGIPFLLKLNEKEHSLLQNNVLILSGEAGTGKSQLFANMAKNIIQNGCYTILLLGHTFSCSNPIVEQIPSQLGLGYALDELLDILEAIGERDNQTVVVFIDAINESHDKNIWKTGMNRLLAKFNQRKHLKLTISVRTGYEALVFDDTMQKKIDGNEVSSLVHNGFRDESPLAVQEFLNHYGVPFSPAYYLQYEMTNPLYLTLFCQTYDGKEIDIFSLFERTLQKADQEAQKEIDFDGTVHILRHLIDELAERQLLTGKNFTSEEEIYNLKFWSTFGLSNHKIKYLLALKRFGLIVSYVRDNHEYYYLSYNLLEDFVCAHRIIESHTSKELLIDYLKNNLLNIKNNKIYNTSNQGIFTMVCGLFAEKYHEECIEIIDVISDKYQKRLLTEEYIRAYLWRKKENIDCDFFLDYINSHFIRREVVWEILIECAAKAEHPLNAYFLHKILKNKSLAYRDSLWTTYINGIVDNDCRVTNLILFLDNGNSLECDENGIMSFLIMCTWFLTSSNRFLRDKTSKAIIELLKHHFEMANKLLVLFEEVNDPYVIQRLYGIIFGACVKRVKLYKEEYTNLVLYVIKNVFQQEYVYPDILMRDYARLIVERYAFEFPEEQDNLDFETVRPPYTSKRIPKVEEQEYYQRNAENCGFNSIAISMLEKWRGDFEHYIFTPAISKFEGIDLSNLQHYAMQFIRDELGYNDSILGEYDTSSNKWYYDQSKVKKVERIGKKYQWIAFYNILARLSDVHLIKEWDEEFHPYAGPWESLYMRDFDPTLNQNFLTSPKLPTFIMPSFNSNDEFFTDNKTDQEINDWCKQQSPFFKQHAENLILTDSTGIQWVFLYHLREIQNQEDLWDPYSLENVCGSQKIWSKSEAYFIKQTNFMRFKEAFEKETPNDSDLPEIDNINPLFNREYGWAPGYHDIFKQTWIDYEVKTGKQILTHHSGSLPKFLNSSDEDISGDELFTFEYKEWDTLEDVMESIGEIAPAFYRFLWEAQYDASQEESTAFFVPCMDIIDYLHLEQKEYDGYFYTKEGILAAFDGSLNKLFDGLVIKKELLDRFLKEKELAMLWNCIGEKQCFQEFDKQIYGKWNGIFYLDDDIASGNFCVQ